MSRFVSSVLMGAALAFSTLPANAQTSSSAASKMSQLAYFNGSWSCLGKDAHTGKTGTSKLVFDMVMNGRWQRQRFDTTGMQSGKPYHSETYFTYNPQLKQIVSLSIGSAGDYGMSSSSGWSGSTMVYNDTVANDNALGRTVLTRLSPNKVGFVIYGREKPGAALTKQISGTCTKSAAAAEESSSHGTQ